MSFAKDAKEQKECGYMRRHSGNFPLQLSPVIVDCKHEKVIRQKLHCCLHMFGTSYAASSSRGKTSKEKEMLYRVPVINLMPRKYARYII